MYIAGLIVFTLASLACGLAQSIEVLIIARVFQGLGASIMTPQTMAVITRIFAPNERGQAMAIWGITAGVAMLVGPILGGFLLDGFGWESIFLINVPVGILGVILALKYVPRLPTSAQRFDVVGVILSAVGMFLVVFGLQEGDTFGWGVITGWITVWRVIIIGALVLIVFVIWQAVQKGEPLMPLRLFHDRNFSVGSASIMTVGLASTSMSLPYMFYLQLVHKLTPTQAALMMLPMAVISIALARPVGKFVDRKDGRFMATGGLFLYGLSMLLYIPLLKPETPIWLLLLPGVVLGFANAVLWGPLATVTMFSLPGDLSGAGSGVYNTSRQVGAVLGSSTMAMLMQSRLFNSFEGTQYESVVNDAAAIAGELPDGMLSGYATAMGESLWLPVIAIFIGVLISLLFAKRPALPSPKKSAAEDNLIS